MRVDDPSEAICRHCGEYIYYSQVSLRWIHWRTVQRQCTRPTVAEPRAER